MKRARGKGRARGRGNAGGGTNRGEASGDTMVAGASRDTMVAGVWQQALRASSIHGLMGQFRRGRGVQLVSDEQCEKVVQWLGEKASSHLSSTQSSTQSQSDAPSSPPGHRTHHTYDPSQELFSNPFSEVLQKDQQQGEEDICSDAQPLEYVPSPGHVDPETASVILSVDDDETQLPLSDCVVMFSEEVEDQIEEVEEEVLDEHPTDPDWQPARDRGESSGDESVCPSTQKAARGRGKSRGRGQCRVIGQSRGRRQATASMATADPGSSQLTEATPSKPRTSVVWQYFNVCADDKLSAVCSLCHSKLSRGSDKSNLTTTGMRRHLEYKHRAAWERANAIQPAPGPAATASSTFLGAATAGRTSSEDTASVSASATLGPSPTPSPSRTCSPAPSYSSSQQLSISQAFERKRKYASSHPQAQALNSHISKLLALEMLPFRLVETQAFRDLMAAAVPRYSVPSRHYFSRTAVPALHRHVWRNITQALSNALSAKVHLTTDSWTSACGQGRYITVTAHWVNVVEAGTGSQPARAYLAPPFKIGSTVSNHPSSSSSSSSAVISRPAASWKRCSTGTGKRQHAVLSLMSLGDRQHTASEVSEALATETGRWLSPLQLGPGMVVSDNARNLVAALELADLHHIPCLAHVFNLVVQKFLKTYPNLPQLLVKVRRLCAHFRKSTVAAANLKKQQQRLHLPQHRLLCDLPTRWNSTYSMLARVCEQQRALMEYQLLHPRVPATQLPQFANHEWPWMADICEVLRIFEESTKKVSSEDAIVSVTIPLIYVLKESLMEIRDHAVQAEETGVGGEASQIESQHTLPSASRWQLQEEEEDEDDMEVEVEEDAGGREGCSQAVCVPLVQRGWCGEEEAEAEEQGMDADDADRSGGGSVAMPLQSVAHMAHFMLGCFSRDKRVQRIVEDELYWVFALLDPRYKDNVSSFIPVQERSRLFLEYQKVLVNQMMERFPPISDGGREESVSPSTPTSHRHTGTRGTLAKVWDTLITAPRASSITAGTSVNRRDMYRRMLREYLADRTPVLPDPSAPYAYWVSKLDTWLELSLYALEVLSCPAASVLSERVFSAAGAIITDKRSRLSTDSAEMLTLIKMNTKWIDPDFCCPIPESSHT